MVVLPSLSSYDAKAVRLLSGVLFDVNRTVERASRSPFSENDRANVTRLVADRLMRDFELGERNRDALKRAAMEDLSVSRAGG
jgi:hypothetical protein